MRAYITGLRCGKCNWNLAPKWNSKGKQQYICCENRACEEYGKPYEIPVYTLVPLDPKKQ